MGEETYANSLGLCVGGGAPLTAMGLRRLGWQVGCVGRLGRDMFGEYAMEVLRREGVDTSWISRFGNPGDPGNVTVALSFRDDRAFVTHQPPGTWVFPPELRTGVTHHHFAGYEGREEIISRARASGTISLDTGWCEGEDWRTEVLSLLPLVDVFLPNQHEALYLSGKNTLKQALDTLSQMGPEVIIKLGPRGALALETGDELLVAGFRVDPVDTTGCGDAFNAGFLDGWLRGKPLRYCLAQGNALGALVATTAGGKVPAISPHGVGRP